MKCVYLKAIVGSLLFSLPIVATMGPAVGAQRIYVAYSALERSIAVDSLEKYAKEGKIDDDLAAYSHYIKPQQLAQLRQVLVTPAKVDALAVSQFLYTAQGEILLQRLGEVIKTESRQPGFYAIRAALILAASDPEGLTLLNVLRKFPTPAIRIDLGRSQRIAGQLENMVNQSRRAIALVTQTANAEVVVTPKVDFSRQQDLQQPSFFVWQKQTLSLNDQKRDRRFSADIYLPKTKTPAPVIIISHGLGSDRSSFDYLAEQLASYGFAVAVPNHPGSDAMQLRALLTGRKSEISEPREFINRPLDVKYLLDELERMQKSDPTLFNINLQQVGVVGQSFGGYTALALGGATLNFQQLQKDCATLKDSWNISLLLQCRALELSGSPHNLQDRRVKALIAINPITSSVFGETSLSQIKIPVMIVGGSADTIAPALSEQILPFTWLTTAEKYLVLIHGGTHFSIIGESAKDALPLPRRIIGPNPNLARRYIKALSVAFLETYVVGTKEYRPYLSTAYVKTISQPPLELSFLKSLTTFQVVQAMGGP